MKPLKILPWATMTLCISSLCVGCSSTGKHLCWYQGPTRGPDEVALLAVQRSILYASAAVETIDGEAIKKGKRLTRNNTREIELLPGTHTLAVAYFEGSTHSISNLLLTATFQSGHTYNLKAEPIDAGAAHTILTTAFGGRGWWTAWITDANTKKVVAGEPRLEPRRWYEY